MDDRSLEQFHIPHDPDAFHQLHWTPGKYGKGFVEPNRQVHTWVTGDFADGYPSHGDYRRAKGLMQGGGPSFWINPDGEVDGWGASKEALRALLKVDPRLHVPDKPGDNWNFAKVTGVDDPDEHVDPSILLPYREYDWNRENNRHGPEHWDDMVADVRANGFREPAYLEYNHETGEGYLGEGNHRVGIAHQLGIPVPLVIYRTRKTKENGYPMKQITEPGQYSMRDERGFSQFGQYMKPSDIGLPTVQPATPQRVGSWGDDDTSSLGKWAWIEGMEPRYWRDVERGDGEGLKPHYQTLLEMAQGHPQLGHIFHQYDSEEDWSKYKPLTKQMDKSGVKWALGIHGPKQARPYMLGPTTTPKDVEAVIGKPLIHDYGHDNAYGIQRTWNFSKVANSNLKWNPGNTGKGFVAGGKIYTWNSSGNRPHHYEMWEHFSKSDPSIPPMTAAFAIGTHGTVEAEYGDPQSYLPYLSQDPRLRPPEALGEVVFSKVAENDETLHTLYHVAPTAARESIQQHGLIGHLGYGEVQSPWQQQHGQPPGNYLYDSYGNALSYVPVLSTGPETGHKYPGDLGMEHFMDYGIYAHPGSSEGYVAPEQPEDFDEWSDEDQDDWYQHQDDMMIPYNHNNPEHRLLLPPNLRGHDIWEIHAPGLAIAPDPENLLVDKAKPKSLEDINNLTEEDEYAMGGENPRFVTHDHIPPHRLRLVRHVPPWEVDDEFASNVHDDGEQVPYDWTLLHPRHTMPKHIPPEVRKIWGKKLARARLRSALAFANMSA